MPNKGYKYCFDCWHLKKQWRTYYVLQKGVYGRWLKVKKAIICDECYNYPRRNPVRKR